MNSKKILCYVLAFIGTLALFGIAVENAPFWWYLLSLCVIYFCYRDVTRIDPEFWIERDKEGRIIE